MNPDNYPLTATPAGSTTITARGDMTIATYSTVSGGGGTTACGLATGGLRPDDSYGGISQKLADQVGGCTAWVAPAPWPRLMTRHLSWLLCHSVFYCKRFVGPGIIPARWHSGVSVPR